MKLPNQTDSFKSHQLIADKTNNFAIPGDKIFFRYRGLKSKGVVRKSLVNSVICSLIVLDKDTELYKEILNKYGIPEETVVSYKRYQVEEWD